MKHYSQLGQDLWVLQQGAYADETVSKFYVEIGAHHPEELSNTKLLEEQGWRGVSIDPFPVGDWSTRSNPLVRAVLWPTETTVRFRCADALGGVDQCITTYREQVKDHPCVDLETLSVARFIAEHGVPARFMYMSLDTEGSEVDLLKAWPFETHRPYMVTVEHNCEEDRRELIQRHMFDSGYVRAPSQPCWDDFYVDML